MVSSVFVGWAYLQYEIPRFALANETWEAFALGMPIALYITLALVMIGFHTVRGNAKKAFFFASPVGVLIFPVLMRGTSSRPKNPLLTTH